MKKNIKNYLHLYLGCQIVYDKDCTWSLNAATVTLTPELLKDILFFDMFLFKLLLRPLSDMREEEYDELEKLNEDETVIEVRNSRFELDFRPMIALTTKRMLEMRFDLFGLIKSGLAESALHIDKTKTN